MANVYTDNSRKLRDSSPSKKRKSNSNNAIVAADDIKYNDNRKRYSTMNKLSYFGKALLEDDDGVIINMMELKNQIHMVARTREGAMAIIKMVLEEETRRAKGMDIEYGTKFINGKKKITRKPHLSHILWAPQVSSSGGGGTGFTPIEMLVFQVAGEIVSAHAVQLKCAPKLGIESTGNIGKMYTTYVMLFSKLGWGWKYQKFVSKRSKESIYKKVKQLMDKKRTDPHSIQFRTTFSKWGEPEGVAKTSMCLLRSTICLHRFIRMIFR